MHSSPPPHDGLSADVLAQVAWLSRPLPEDVRPEGDRRAFVPLIRWLLLTLAPTEITLEGAAQAFWRALAAETRPMEGPPLHLVDCFDRTDGALDRAGQTLWLVPPANDLPIPGLVFDLGTAGRVVLTGALPEAFRAISDGDLRAVSDLFGPLGRGFAAPSDAETARLRQRIDELLLDRQEERRRFERTLAEIYASRSWRVTAPLRLLQGAGVKQRVKLWLRAKLLALPLGAALLALRRRVLRPQGGSAQAPDLLAAKAAFRAQKTAALTDFMAGDTPLRLPRAARPEVSIVLVLWNQAELTYACLSALAAETEVSLEVVIVDNASTDATPALLARVEGATLLPQSDNLGFLRAVNLAVPQCRAPRVVLLNNDAVMRPGSLAAALATLQSSPDIGAVGGRIVLPNGRLQEAGSIIWRDGSCLGYGRDLLPDAGEAMFRRDVDYASGAFLLFNRDAFEAMGGLDDRFAPAYYEETDFCLRLWQRGLRVVYEPRAVIDHFEFGSAQKSETALALQQRNQGLFEQKHRSVLAGHRTAGSGQELWARMRSGLSVPKPARILVIDDQVPLPSLGAGLPRARDILTHLAGTGRFVTFYPMAVPTEDWDKTYAALPPTVEVAMGRGRSGLEAFLEARRGYYDAVLVSRPHNMAELGRLMAKHAGLLGAATLIYDAEAVFALRDLTRARLFGLTPAIQQAEQAVGAELDLARPARRVLTVSDSEAAHFRAAGFADVQILGHGLTPDPTPRPFAERHDLLFVGRLTDDHSPNVDSLLWFAREIMPRLRALLPDRIDLLACGRAEAPSLRAIAGQGIGFIGEVDDLRPYYDRCRVFVAPTRFAGGIPHKVHEAAAHGLPVVCTPLLAQQLGWSSGDAVLAAADPDGFAAEIARLYTDTELWHRLRSHALARVSEDCSPALFAERVEAALRF